MEAVMTRKSVLGKNVLRNEKGLTLLELLAVIVILGIIAAIAIPSIGGIIKNTKDKANFSNALMIVNAAKFKVTNDAPTANTDYSLSELVDEGYLDTAPLDPKTKAGYNGGATNNGVPVKGSKTGTYVAVTFDSTSGKYSYVITLKGSDGRAIGNAWTEADLLESKATLASNTTP